MREHFWSQSFIAEYHINNHYSMVNYFENSTIIILQTIWQKKHYFTVKLIILQQGHLFEEIRVEGRKKSKDTSFSIPSPLHWCHPLSKAESFIISHCSNRKWKQALLVGPIQVGPSPFPSIGFLLVNTTLVCTTHVSSLSFPSSTSLDWVRV